MVIGRTCCRSRSCTQEKKGRLQGCGEGSNRREIDERQRVGWLCRIRLQRERPWKLLTHSHTHRRTHSKEHSEWATQPDPGESRLLYCSYSFFLSLWLSVSLPVTLRFQSAVPDSAVCLLLFLFSHQALHWHCWGNIEKDEMKRWSDKIRTFNL